jgi:hypothetical protein
MKLIQQAMEDHYDGLVKNEGSHDELEFHCLLNKFHFNSPLIIIIKRRDISLSFLTIE